MRPFNPLEPEMEDQKISEPRQVAYYLGMTLQVLGFISFFSVFISMALDFGDHTDFAARGRSSALRAFGGMALIIIGSLISRIGSHGLSGSGIILDPDKARRDVKPYSRMTGGIITDTLKEVELPPMAQSQPTIMVRCQSCQTLNPESANFCQECGTRL